MEKKLMDNNLLKILNSESLDDFIKRLIENKQLYNISYYNISDIVYRETGFLRSEKYYRNYSKKIISNKIKNDINQNNEQIISTLQKEKIKYLDTINSYNRIARIEARDEFIKEILQADLIKKLNLDKPFINKADNKSTSNQFEGILLLSDWHYGLEFENSVNSYSPEITDQRVLTLFQQVIESCDRFHIRKLHILNLGDMISGKIHVPIRIENRIDTITQLIKVSELLSDFLYNICFSGISVDYYSCTDNHSRISDNKADNLDSESLARIIPWFIEERLKNTSNFKIIKNNISQDIIKFNVFDYNVVGLHGDNDKDVLKSTKVFFKDHIDLFCIAHLHHFTVDEDNNSILVRNGSLVGTDSFSYKLRKNNISSQTMIVASEDNIIKAVLKLNCK